MNRRDGIERLPRDRRVSDQTPASCRPPLRPVVVKVGCDYLIYYV